MATYTPNIGLHQWAPEDNFLRTDFNTDLSKIDTALGTITADKCECMTGTYEGNGRDNRFIDLGKTPSVVLLCDEYSAMKDGNYTFGGLALKDFPSTGLTITEDGFTVRQNGTIYCNDAGAYTSRMYYYTALF